MAERIPEAIQKKLSERLHFYEDLGDSLVAEECTFAIALAQRVMSDAGRRSQRKSEPAKEPTPPIKVVYDPANESMSA